MNFLIIEDNKLFAELIAVALKAQHVKVATTMAEALAIIDDCAPNVILLDLSLPDSNAGETMAKIREIKARAKGAMVVVVTGDSSPQTKEAVMNNGADMFIDKYSGDIFFHELREKIKYGTAVGPTASSETVRQIEQVVASLTGMPFDLPKMSVRLLTRVLPLLQDQLQAQP